MSQANHTAKAPAFTQEENTTHRRTGRDVPLLGLVALAGVLLLILSSAPVHSTFAAAFMGPSDKTTGPAPAHTYSTTPACSPDWQVIASPNAITGGNDLYDVAALTANDVWAVGSYNDGTRTRTLITHWDGSAWSVVPSLNPGSTEVNLYSVSAISADDVWVVGDYYSGSLAQTLTMHWNGTLWSLIPSPYPGTSNNTLSSVAAVSSNDVWAVGYYSNGGAGQTLILHWDGSAWLQVSSPNHGTTHNTLSAIAALSPNDIWAVGTYYTGTVDQTLTMHWDGISWELIDSPNHSTTEPNRLYGVAAVSNAVTGQVEVWAVGGYSNGTVDQTLVLHWDGSAWAITPSPNVGTRSDSLEKIAALSPDDIWVVGSFDDEDVDQTLTMHWNGTIWEVISSPNFGADKNVLSGIAAVSSGDVWAMGYYYNGSVDHTLALQWNSSTWNIVQSANAGDPGDSQLQAIAALSSNDMWAVGFYFSGPADQTLAMHWDGSAWTVVPSPNVGESHNTLQAIDAASPSDIWTVGSYTDPGIGGAQQTLVEHWDGSAWNVVPSPNAGTGSYLYGVTAISANDTWAVGNYRNAGVYQTLTMHWNGADWSIVPSPNTGTGHNFLNGIDAVSSGDVWAVGHSAGTPSQTFTLHWDGSAWQLLLSPSPGTVGNDLLSVEAVGTNDVWAVGYYSNPGVDQALIVHWNGSTWSAVPSPNVGSDVNTLYDVGAVAADDIWAVGSYDGGTAYQTLIEHWDGNAWNVVSSPNVGSEDNYLNRVAAVSATDIWAVGTYSPDTLAQTLVERYNPCTCPEDFTDVPPGSTFYSYVHCMACQGIINGYSSGCETGNPCFRPNNNVTRGQLAKIVANAAGFTEPPDAQQFEDVPIGSTFFDFIWRLNTRGVVNGYPCGGLSEPCVPPDNRPYFRPNNQATRGQISKIIAIAANLPMPPPGQTFEDVPEGSTFGEYIEALVAAGAINGYPCGSAGEPCVPPENRPYFRPSSNATRGQTSKIVSNTFFPGCMLRTDY